MTDTTNWTVLRSGYKTIVQMGAPNCAEIVGPDHSANARLIAATPDLLAMLVDAYQYMVNYEVCQNQGLLDDMQAAIAKAKGN